MDKTQDYSYLRQLTRPLSEEEHRKASDLLQSNQIEFQEMASSGQMVYPDDSIETDRTIYVTAADQDMAISLIKGANFDSILIPKEESDIFESELDQATRLFYKKRRALWIECLIIIILVAIYSLIMGD